MSSSKKQRGREALLRRMEELANGRVNDAVKLAFLGSGLPPEQWERIDALELEELAEFKRSGNGTVEIKLVDRLAALEKLIALAGDGEREKAEQFFRAGANGGRRGERMKTARRHGDSGRRNRRRGT